ncbi:MAG: efflux RND transporter periplasmic adaptor subunit [Planctomycetia bacterium]
MDADWPPVALLLVALAAGSLPAAAAAGPVNPQVVVARVEEMDLAAARSFVGTVYPARVSDVGSAVDGRVVRLPVEDGQRVAAGEPIAELLRGLLEIERTGAAAELERRSQVLAELRAGSRAEDIDQARAVVAGITARLEYARNRLSRQSRLAERGTSTEDELLVAQTDVSQAESELARARAALALAEAGPRAEAIAQAAAAVATQQAAVERIDDQLGKHTIRAPFAGWVVERFTEEGQWLARGGLVARIAELDFVEIDVRVPELAVGTLATGVDVRLEIDAVPQQTWIGTVERIVPQADLLSRSFPVKVRLENRIVDGQPLLRGGMLARAWLPVGKTGPATVVPKDALVLGAGSPLVFVVDPGATPGSGTVRSVPVAPGAAVAGNVEIRGDVRPDQLVVVRGNERLRPGMQVSFTP